MHEPKVHQQMRWMRPKANRTDRRGQAVSGMSRDSPMTAVWRYQSTWCAWDCSVRVFAAE
jgi:hypothetical protein